MKQKVYMNQKLIFLILGITIGLVIGKIIFRGKTNIVKETSQILSPQANDLSKKQTLPPPEFADSMGPIITSDIQGHVLIKIKPVLGAKKSRAVITNIDGTRVEACMSSSSIIYFDSLPMPDNTSKIQYNVQLVSLDDTLKEGELGPARKLIVTDGSGSSLVAPKIKSIKVED